MLIVLEFLFYKSGDEIHFEACFRLIGSTVLLSLQSQQLSPDLSNIRSLTADVRTTWSLTMRDTTPPLDVSLLLSWWGEEELEEEEEDEELRDEEDEAETKSELKEGTEDGEEEEMEGIARRFGSNLLFGTRQASPFLTDQTWMLPFCQLQIC